MSKIKKTLDFIFEPTFKFKMKTYLSLLSLALLLAFSLSDCQQKTTEDNEKKDSEITNHDLPWLQSAVIYEVNLRQFSSSGNFKGLAERLDTLKNLGVDILSFSIIQPVAKGSRNFITDFKAVNPDLGTMDDFRNLIEKCHEKKFKVIINWDGNYISEESKLSKEHPQWFIDKEKTKSSQILVGGHCFNYANEEVKSFMTDVMKWWIDESDIDGFNCENSEFPNTFWNAAIQELNQTKKVLMVSKTEQKGDANNSFNLSYANEFNKLLGSIFKLEKNTDSLINYFTKTKNDELKLNYLTNFGEASDAFKALSFTIQGLPLIMNGTEVGFNLKENETINWNQPNAAKQIEFYKTLISIRHKNPALWNNVDGQTNTRVFKSTKEIYAFIKQSGQNKVFVVLNLSNKTVQMDALEIPGLEQYSLRLYKDLKTDGVHLYELGPWGYSISTLNEPNEHE